MQVVEPVYVRQSWVEKRLNAWTQECMKAETAATIEKLTKVRASSSTNLGSRQEQLNNNIVLKTFYGGRLSSRKSLGWKASCSKQLSSLYLLSLSLTLKCRSY